MARPSSAAHGCRRTDGSSRAGQRCPCGRSGREHRADRSRGRRPRRSEPHPRRPRPERRGVGRGDRGGALLARRPDARPSRELGKGSLWRHDSARTHRAVPGRGFRRTELARRRRRVDRGHGEPGDGVRPERRRLVHRACGEQRREEQREGQAGARQPRGDHGEPPAAVARRPPVATPASRAAAAHPVRERDVTAAPRRDAEEPAVSPVLAMPRAAKEDHVTEAGEQDVCPGRSRATARAGAGTVQGSAVKRRVPCAASRDREARASRRARRDRCAP
jgi:hypothetical protein